MTLKWGKGSLYDQYARNDWANDLDRLINTDEDTNEGKWSKLYPSC